MFESNGLFSQFTFVRPYIYSVLGSNSIEGFMPVAISSVIEGHRRICILLLLMLGYNLYNIYVILYGSPRYGDISILLMPGLLDRVPCMDPHIC